MSKMSRQDEQDGEDDEDEQDLSKHINCTFQGTDFKRMQVTCQIQDNYRI